MLPVRSCLAAFRRLALSASAAAYRSPVAAAIPALRCGTAGAAEASRPRCEFSTTTFSRVQELASSKRSPVASVHRNPATEAKAAEPVDINALVAHANEQIAQQATGRLFAVVQVSGKQFKVTPEDIVVVEGEFGPEVGERIRLEKVLLVGGEDFTLVGRPLLSHEEALVEATIIEKTLQYPKAWFLYKRRKRVRRFRLLQKPLVMLRINDVRALTVRS